MVNKKGIDVSKYQKNIDWSKVDASGIDFVLIRAGLGNAISQEDIKFDSNVQGALAHKLNVGAYWFSYAISVEDVLKEAEVFKQVLAPYKSGKLDFPIAFDYEYASIAYSKKMGVNPSNALIDSIAKAFMDSMKAAGWFVNLYTNIDFIRSGKFSASTIKSYDIWLADYTGAPDFACGIQQTGSTGSVNGISGNVDIDVAFKDYSTIIRSGGYNGYVKSQSTIVDIDTTMDISFAHGAYYTVKTTSIKPVKLTYGTGNVVTIVPLPRVGNDQLFAIVAISQTGQETGIFTTVDGESPVKRFKFKIK